MTPSRLRGPFRVLGFIVRDAAASLLLRPGHTIGMISGVLLGVASALAAVVIADTQQAQVDLRFDLQRSEHAVVKAGGASAGFDSRQVKRIAALEPISDVGEFSVWTESITITGSAGLRSSTGPLLVADPGGLRATGVETVSGSDPTLMNAKPELAIAWVGADLAADLGVSPATAARPGDAQVLVAGQPLSVVGILDNDGQFGYLSRAVVVSRSVAVSNIGGAGTNIRLVAHVRPGSAGAVVQYMLLAADPGGELGLFDVTPPDGELLVADVGSDLRLVGAAIGGFIGLVGMVAVANTLMMSVHQRQRELGLRSAMGWSRRRIGMLVLTESAIAGLLAGLIGSGLGLLAAASWCWTQGWTLVMPTLLPVLVVTGGLLASLIGGLIPALRAASVSPMTAMRS